MSKTKQPQPLQKASLSYKEMNDAIPQIERRIDELQKFDVNSVNANNDNSDPKITSLEQRLNDLLLSIFGANTIEYNNYFRIAHLDTASRNYGYLVGPTTTEEIKERIRKNIENAIEQLQTIKQLFMEKLEDAGRTMAGRTLKAYDGLELHAKIEQTVGKLFRDGHYSNAIEDSVKVLNALVRLNSGISDKDGMNLMEYVFNPKNPILKFNNLVDDPDMDEQKGFMMLFSGAVAGLRNPRAHKIIQDDPEMTLEFIAFISLLAKLVDKAKK